MEDEKRIENEVTSDTSSAASDSGALGEDVYTEGDDSEKGISARRKKNQALFDEELREMAARLFKGDYDMNKKNGGCDRGYYLSNMTLSTEHIIDVLEEHNAKIKLYRDLDSYDYFIQPVFEGRPQEIVELSRFMGTCGDTILVNKGGIVNSKSNMAGIRDFLGSFVDMKDKNAHYFHKTIGFNEKCDLFKGINIIPLGIEKDEQNKETVQKMLESEFMPDNKTLRAIGRRGDFDTFKQGIQELVKPYPLLVFALAVGVYGVVLQWLDYSYKLNGWDNLVVNIAAGGKGSTSSIGKSITTELMLVMFGRPKGLMAKYDTTRAKRDDILKQLKIVPLCTDDFVVGIANRTIREKAGVVRDYIFSGSSGETKGTYNNDSIQYYCPLVTSTEERLVNILALSGVEMGGARRLLEIACELGDLTKDKEHADKLQRLVGENYGFIDEFIKGLTEKGIGIDEIKRDIEDSEKQLNELNLFKSCNDSHIAGDWNRTLAIIAVCIDLLNKSFGFEGDGELNYIGVIQVLVKNIKENMAIYSECRDMSKELNKNADNEEPMYLPYINNVYAKYYGNPSMFKKSREQYQKEVIEKCEEYENAVTGFDKAAIERKKLLTGCIGFEGYVHDCEDRCLLVRGEKNMKWLMGIENESNDVFKSIVRMMLRDGVMIKGNGQGENANTVKLKIGNTRTNYYAINLDLIENGNKTLGLDFLECLYDSEGDIVDVDDEQEGDEE